MRILFVSDTYYPHINGVYYFVCRIGPLLQEKGHQVAVIAPSEKFGFTKKKIDNLDVYGIASVPLFYYPNLRIPVAFRLRSRIKQILKDFNPDIIHIQDHFLIARTIVETTKNSGIPVMGTNHFMAENLTALFRSERFKCRLARFVWSRFTAVFNQLEFITTPTETAAALIRPKLDRNVIAISSGIDLEKYAPAGNGVKIKERYSIPDKPVLLFVGRLDPEKNVDEILQAMAIVVRKIDLCFVIVGKGLEKSSLESLTGKLGLRDNVVFTGFVPEDDLPFLYNLSHCFIIASVAELLSLATLQAMASALPVIAVNSGALPELVHNNSNGFIFKSGDICAIALFILELFTNHELHASMSEKSREAVLKHDIRRTVASFERLYERQTLKKNSLPVSLKKYLIVK